MASNVIKSAKLDLPGASAIQSSVKIRFSATLLRPKATGEGRLGDLSDPAKEASAKLPREA